MVGKVVCKSTHTEDDKKPSPGKWKTVPHLHLGMPTGYLCIQFGNDEMTISEALKPADARIMAASKELYQELKTAPLPREDEADSEFIARYGLWLGGSRRKALRKAEASE
jgi:hypothetical protein